MQGKCTLMIEMNNYRVTRANVDTSTPGTYTVTYTVGDLAGNQAQATRTVTVEAGGPPLLAFAGATKLRMYIPSHRS